MKKVMNEILRKFTITTLIVACGPITREVEEARVENNPPVLSSGVSSLETDFFNKGKLVLFKYDPKLYWMRDVCLEEKESGVFVETRDKWLREASEVISEVVEGAASVNTKNDLKKMVKTISKNNADVAVKLNGMLEVISAYELLIRYDCQMSYGYRDRLAYMKTRLLALGLEQDQLYLDKFRIEQSLIGIQKGLSEKLKEKILTLEESLPQKETRILPRLKYAVGHLKTKSDTMSNTWESKRNEMSAKLMADDAALTPVVGDDGGALPIYYKCKNEEDFLLKNQMMKDLETLYSLKLSYRCADSDLYALNQYKSQGMNIKKVIKLSIEKMAPLYQDYKAALGNYEKTQLEYDRVLSGEPSSMGLCQIEVDSGYEGFDEEKTYCDKKVSLESMGTDLPLTRVTLCTLVGEEEGDSGYDPKEIMRELPSADEKTMAKQQCVERKTRKDMAGRSIELGDDWLRKYASAPSNVLGAENNLENYYIATDGQASLNFSNFRNQNEFNVELPILQNLYIPATESFGYVNKVYSTYNPGEITNLSFNGNSLRLVLNLKEVLLDGTEAFSGEKIELDLDMVIIGGVRKLQGDAWFIQKDGSRKKGSAKITLDS